MQPRMEFRKPSDQNRQQDLDEEDTRSEFRIPMHGKCMFSKTASMDS